MDNSIYKFLYTLNTNFKRKTLRELLLEDKPYIIINERRHRIKKRELDLINELTYNKDLKIPILLEIESSLESGTVKINGYDEIIVISKILNREINLFSKESSIYIYKPELRILRRKLPTTTAYIFKIGSY